MLKKAHSSREKQVKGDRLAFSSYRFRNIDSLNIAIATSTGVAVNNAYTDSNYLFS